MIGVHLFWEAYLYLWDINKTSICILLTIPDRKAGYMAGWDLMGTQELKETKRWISWSQRRPWLIMWPIRRELVWYLRHGISLSICIASTVAADVLSPLGAMASAGTVMTKLTSHIYQTIFLDCRLISLFGYQLMVFANDRIHWLCSFVCRLHHLIIIIMQTYLRALNH